MCCRLALSLMYGNSSCSAVLIHIQPTALRVLGHHLAEQRATDQQLVVQQQQTLAQQQQLAVTQQQPAAQQQALAKQAVQMAGLGRSCRHSSHNCISAAATKAVSMQAGALHCHKFVFLHLMYVGAGLRELCAQ